jgi:hypothetical protein
MTEQLDWDEEMSNLDPSSVKGPPVQQHVARKLFDKAPGFIAAIMRNGATAQGARLVRFTQFAVPVGLEPEDEKDYRVNGDYKDASAEEVMNDYFARRGNLILLEMWPINDGTGDIVALIGTTFDEQDLEEWEEIQRVVEREMTKYRSAKENDKAKAELASKAAAEQLKADAEVGRKVREHNLLGKLRDLEDEMVKLRAENNKLKGSKS